MTAPKQYATAVEFRSVVNKVGATDDAVIDMWLQAASDCIDRVSNHNDGFVATAQMAREFYSLGKSWVPLDEFTSITVLEVKQSPTANYETWAPTDYMPFRGDPRRPKFNLIPYNALLVRPGGKYIFFPQGKYSLYFQNLSDDYDNQWTVPMVRATCAWGYSVTAPAVVKTAAIAQAARWYKRGQGAWSDALATAGSGTLLYTKALDPDIEMMLVNSGLCVPVVG